LEANSRGENVKENPKDHDESEEGEVEEKEQISIAEPMFFWILLLVVAMVINVLINAGYAPSDMASTLKASANFILFMPGSIILPTIVGAFIGAEIGKRSKSMYVAVKSGIINGVYAAIIYLISIFIIYEVILYILPSINPGVDFLALNWLALPSAILIALSVIFAILSHSRKVA
jgi:hypothetical protein